MTRGWISIAFACALGALIGTLAALEISTRFAHGSYLWGIGALLGGIVAYVAIDFRYFCAGIVHSYRKTIAWRPYTLWWRAFGSSFVACAAFLPTSVAALAIFLGFVFAFDSKMPEYTLLGIFVYAPLAIIAISILILPFTGTFVGWAENRRNNQTTEVWENGLNSTIERNWDMACTSNPIAVAIVIMRYAIRIGTRILRNLRYQADHLPETSAAIGTTLKVTGKTFCMFVAGVFVYVHSQRRMICFVDATLGAAIGYSFGSAIIGTVAGAILGIVNYELVSIRWLKLAPSR